MQREPQVIYDNGNEHVCLFQREYSNQMIFIAYTKFTGDW